MPTEFTWAGAANSGPKNQSLFRGKGPMADEFIQIKNWEKFQPGRSDKSLTWIKDYTDKDFDSDYMALSCLQRYLLDGLCRLRGRLGKNPYANPTYIARALHVTPKDAPHIPHAIRTLSARGFLSFTNQQHNILVSHEKRREEERRGDMHPPAGHENEDLKTIEDLDPLVISHKIIEELGLPVRSVGLVPAIAGALDFCLKNESSATTKQAAVDFLIAEGKKQLASGGGIDRFWFESQKWRKKRKPVESNGSGTISGVELAEQIRARKAEVAAQRAKAKIQ